MIKTQEALAMFGAHVNEELLLRNERRSHSLSKNVEYYS